MNALRILIIDDEKLIRWSLEKHLKASGHTVYSAESGEAGIELAQKHYPQLTFLDNRLPGIQGLDVLTKLKEIDEEMIVLFMTAYGSVETAVEAMKRGALEYLNKPFSLEEALILTENISKKISISTENKVLKRNQKEDTTFNEIIGSSPAMKGIKDLAKKIATTETTTVLLLGESGTGKDLFARAIHNESERKNKPFVTINCSSLPDTLLESELFGHEKGAFTDAKNLKKGLFEIAEGGTVFLDEIGEISLSTQIKLLGILENRFFRRLGGLTDIPIDVRIIAATNKNMLRSVEEKTFREDLYYRLKVFQLIIPSLRDRKEDIESLVLHFMNLFNQQFNKNMKSIGLTAGKALLAYDWPGNVRELRNVIERAVILESSGSLGIESLPNEISGNFGTVFADSWSGDKEQSKMITLSPTLHFTIPEEGFSLDEMEKRLIQQALLQTGYNQSKAAKILGISRDTLRYKQKKFEL